MKLKFWIGMIISAACLYFVFHGIDVRKALNALNNVNYWYLAFAVFLQLSTIWIRAERWKYLLEPMKQFHFWQLVPATMIGFMANNILPARAGEFVRAYVIGKKANISKTSCFATIIIERVFDMATMLGFLVVVLLIVKLPQLPTSEATSIGSTLFSASVLTKLGAASAVFVFGLLAFLIVLKEFPEKTTFIIEKLLTHFPQSITKKAITLLHSFRDGLHVLNTGTHLLFVIFWSIVVWVAAALGGWITLLAFGLDLPFKAGIFVMVMVAFSVAIPSSPGYIGPFHAAVSASILFFLPTLDKSAVAGISIVFHLACIGPVTLMGVYYLWRENLSFSEIRHIEEEEQQILDRNE